MKRIYSICLIVLLCLFQVTPAFASVATSSNWIPDAGTASPSDWNFFTPFDWDSFEEEFEISPYGSVSHVPAVANTVNFSYLQAEFIYYNTSGVQRTVYSSIGADGHFSFTRPSDYSRPRGIGVALKPGALPPPGTYDLTVRIGSNTVLGPYSDAYIYSNKSIQNASNVTSAVWRVSDSDFLWNSGGDFSVHSVVSMGGVNYFSVGALFSSSANVSFNISVDCSVNFTRTTKDPTYISAGGPQSSQDIQQDISNSAGQIADNTEAINGTLKELIQHISDQLHALWDQMYNYMHLRLVANDNARTQRIIDRLDEGFDINVEVLDRNFHDLMANDDKNTNTVVNGFDNSKFNSANNQLQTSIDVYDKAETDIFDSVKGDITGFQIPDFTSNVQVLAAVGFSSNYLQRLFNAIGFFNLPVTVSLVMIFVLMVLGYYRVRN